MAEIEEVGDGVASLHLEEDETVAEALPDILKHEEDGLKRLSEM